MAFRPLDLSIPPIATTTIEESSSLSTTTRQTRTTLNMAPIVVDQHQQHRHRPQDVTFIPYSSIKPLVDGYIQLWFGRGVMDQNPHPHSKGGSWTPLLEAVHQGDESSVFMLLLHGQHFFDKSHRLKMLQTQDENGDTALHFAIERGGAGGVGDGSIQSSYSSIARLLLNYDIHDNDDDDDDNHYNHCNHFDKEPPEKKSQSSRINLNIQNHEGITPLHLACHSGQLELAQRLLERGANLHETEHRLGMTALHYATQKGHDAVVELLLRHGASINGMDECAGFSPLHIAAQNNQISTARLLCDHHHGANLHACDRNRRTPLHLAALKGHDTMVQLLLERGADLTATGPKFNALQVAAYCGHASVVQIVLQQAATAIVGSSSSSSSGSRTTTATTTTTTTTISKTTTDLVDARVVDGSSATALYLASWNGHASVVKLLLQCGGANIHARAGIHDWTSLHVAVIGGKRAVVQVLLEQGADCTITDRHGWTPLQWAKRRGHESIVRLLVAKEAARL